MSVMMSGLLCLFLCVCATVHGFNVDTETSVLHRGTPNSMFGFAVQAHVEGDQKMLLVGAPEADTHRQPDLVRPGAVFRCDPHAPGRCREMPFDFKGNNVDRQHRQVDSKSNQWFGATLSSTGVNGPIVACAPRYVSYVTASQDQRNPVGSCYLAKTTSSADISEFSPCRTSSHGQRKTGVCQAGFSAAISKDGQRLFMGAPGSWYWQGRTFSLDPTEKFTYFMPKIPEEGQLYSQSLEQKPTLISTLEQSSKYDDSYMGYSIAVGDFAGQAVQGVAVGVPRGSDLLGLVILFTWELQTIKNIHGTQLGAYFGYSVAAADVDGDGRDDLIVGAPMYTRPKSDGYEHGRVYVIYQGLDRDFSKNHYRTGEVSRGRFGLSVASLGDINLDSFGDFAVGAPYGGPNGRGAVFIYHGSAEGVRETHSQLILAEDVSPPPYIDTFGWSLSGGVDLDSNNYTDLVVGAYKSDSVVFLRSRPVVKAMAEVRFMGASKLISLTDKRCSLRNGTRVACAHLKFCLTYDGINVDSQIEFRVTLDLDSKQKTSKRLFLMESRKTTYSEHILLLQRQQGCREFDVYLDEEIRDKLTPIEVSMTYSLVSGSGSIPAPVLDTTLSNVATDSLSIQKNCGADNVCVPDLALVVTTPTVNYVLGSNEMVRVDVSVSNSLEDAFEAAYFLRLPPGVTYSKMERADDGDTRVYCSVVDMKGGNSTVRCDLGNPMASKQESNFNIFMQVEPHVTELSFDMEVNSTNPEKGTYEDNTRTLQIGVVVKAAIKIEGISDPPELHYNSSLYATSSEQLYDDAHLGPQLIHKYNIVNEGPFPIEEAEIYIMWPYQTLNGDNLMYMVVQPEWLGDMQCGAARHVNPNNLIVKNPYSSPLLAEKLAMMNNTELYRDVKIKTGGDYYGQSTYLQGQGSASGVNLGSHTQGSYQGSYNQGSGSHAQGSFTQSGSYGGQVSQGGSFAQGDVSHNRGTFAQGDVSHNRGSFAQEGVFTQDGSFGASQGGSFAHGSQSQGSFAQGSHSQGAYGHGSHSQGAYGTQGSYSGAHATYGQRGSEGSEEVHGFNEEEEESIRRNIASNVASGVHGGNRGVGRETIVRAWNKTILYDSEGNKIDEVESSTQWGMMGKEGEAGSSFRNRYGSDVHHQQTYQNRAQGQGQVQGQAQGQFIPYSSGGINDQRHTWSTEETVNRDVMNRASSSFASGSKDTVVGDDEEDIQGFGAYAARGSNNQFKYGFADLGVNSGQSGQSGQYGGQSGQWSGGQSSSGRQSGGYSGLGGQAVYSGSQSSSGGGAYHHSYSSSSQSGSQSSYGYGSQREVTRKRREDIDNALREQLELCQAKYKCEVIRCTTGRLTKGQEVWVALRSRINASVLNDLLQQNSQVQLSTLAMTRITRLSFSGRHSDSAWHIAEDKTVVTPQLEALSSGAVPLWVVVLAAVAGALLLILLVLLLYKCGFFKRNRPSSAAERQPLNGRDEHL